MNMPILSPNKWKETKCFNPLFYRKRSYHLNHKFSSLIISFQTAATSGCITPPYTEQIDTSILHTNTHTHSMSNFSNRWFVVVGFSVILDVFEGKQNRCIETVISQFGCCCCCCLWCFPSTNFQNDTNQPRCKSIE